jgi:hypothetical protein
MFSMHFWLQTISQRLLYLFEINETLVLSQVG